MFFFFGDNSWNVRYVISFCHFQTLPTTPSGTKSTCGGRGQKALAKVNKTFCPRVSSVTATSARCPKAKALKWSTMSSWVGAQVIWNESLYIYTHTPYGIIAFQKKQMHGGGLQKSHSKHLKTDQVGTLIFKYIHIWKWGSYTIWLQYACRKYSA